MNSIINPWVFYWIGIVDSVRTLLIVILTVLMIGGAIMFMCTMSDRGVKDKDVAEEVKLCINVAIATFVVAVLVCVVPSEDTCYKMLAAKMFTQDNINNATEYVTDVIDYAVDKVKEMDRKD